MPVCRNCQHRRQYHKKVDGNAWCSVPFCSCREFVEVERHHDRRKLHDELDNFLDQIPPE